MNGFNAKVYKKLNCLLFQKKYKPKQQNKKYKKIWLEKQFKNIKIKKSISLINQKI